MGLWNRLNFASKLAVCLFCANLVATVLAISLLYGNARNEALRMNTLLNEKNLAITKSNIENVVESAESSAISIFFEHGVKEQILNEGRYLETPGSYNEVNTQLLRVMNTTSSIQSITLYKRNGSSLSTRAGNSGYFEDYASFVEYCSGQGLFLSGETSSSRWCTLLPADDGTGRDASFVNVRELKDVAADEASAIMLVYLRESTIYNMYAFFGEDSFMLNEDGIVVSAGDKSLIGSRLTDEALADTVLASKRQTMSFPYGNGEAQYCSSIYIPSLSCYLVAVPSYDVLATTQQALGLTSLLLIGSSILLSLLLAKLISNGITGKIRALKQTMEATDLDLGVRFHASGNDEINYLGDTFNRLMEQIESYVDEVKETQSRKRASDLQLLQSQINPHLLYNTLDSVLLSLSHNDTQTVRHTIELLSDYFKVSLSQGQAFVPLGTEVRHIEKYMELQRICRGKQIRLQVAIPESLLQMLILKTVLQPIVENSFLHAFVGSFSDGEIHISAQQKDGMLKIVIADNGLGMQECMLEELNRQLCAEQPAKSYGLWNVNQRLINHYGTQSGITLQSELGEGTCVVVLLPCPPDTYTGIQ